MSWDAIDALDDARAASQSLLLPFDVGTWARLALIAFFVGPGTGGSASAGTNASSPAVPSAEVPVGGVGPLPFPPGGLPAPDVRSVLFVAAAALVAFVALFVVYSAVSAVMQFVLVSDLAERTVRIRRPFREHLGKGLRLFGFQAALVLLVFAVVAVPGGLLFLLGASVGPELLLLAVPVVLLAVIAGLVAALVVRLTVDFVVPAMLADDCGVLDGWRRVFPVIRGAWEEFALYVVLRFGLGILAGALLAVGIGLVALVVALPFLLVGGVVAFLAVSAGSGTLSPLAIGTLAVVGLLYLLATAVVGAFVLVPVVTFLRYYALYFLGAVEEGLDLVGVDRESDESERPGSPAV
jgi:hypothetical protein